MNALKRRLADVLIRLNVPSEKVREALETSDRRALQELLAAEWQLRRRTLVNIIASGLGATASRSFSAAWNALPDAPPVGTRNPAISYARRRTGWLITRMDRQARRTTRILTSAAVASGEGPRVLARTLVRAGLGLDAVRAGAIANETARLERLVARGDMTPERATRRITRLSQQKIRNRAEAIARTETLRAHNGGRQEAWNRAIRTGTIDEGEWLKEWVATSDARTDDVCRRLNGTRTFIRGEFWNGLQHPPQHPRCRCAAILVRP